MPWCSTYPALSKERAAEIRRQIDEIIDQDISQWEADLIAQIRWVNEGKTWVEETGIDAHQLKMAMKRDPTKGISP